MSKINIETEKPTYIIKPEDGVVVCSIQARGVDNHHNLFISNSSIQKIRKRFHIYRINEWKTFKVVVRLHKDDKWNEVIGKRIAESKCKKKIYNFYKRLYKFALNEIVRTDIEDMIRYVDNLTFCEDREEKHFKELIRNED